eukprot:g7086.t1
MRGSRQGVQSPTEAGGAPHLPPDLFSRGIEFDPSAAEEFRQQHAQYSPSAKKWPYRAGKGDGVPPNEAVLQRLETDQDDVTIAALEQLQEFHADLEAKLAALLLDDEHREEDHEQEGAKNGDLQLRTSLTADVRHFFSALFELGPEEFHLYLKELRHILDDDAELAKHESAAKNDWTGLTTLLTHRVKARAKPSTGTKSLNALATLMSHRVAQKTRASTGRAGFAGLMTVLAHRGAQKAAEVVEADAEHRAQSAAGFQGLMSVLAHRGAQQAEAAVEAKAAEAEHARAMREQLGGLMGILARRGVMHADVMQEAVQEQEKEHAEAMRERFGGLMTIMARRAAMHAEVKQEVARKHEEKMGARFQGLMGIVAHKGAMHANVKQEVAARKYGEDARRARNASGAEALEAQHKEKSKQAGGLGLPSSSSAVPRRGWAIFRHYPESGSECESRNPLDGGFPCSSSDHSVLSDELCCSSKAALSSLSVAPSSNNFLFAPERMKSSARGPSPPYLVPLLALQRDLASAGITGFAHPNVDTNVLVDTSIPPKEKFRLLFGLTLNWKNFPIVRVESVEPKNPENQQTRAFASGVAVGDRLVMAVTLKDRITLVPTWQGKLPEGAILEKVKRRAQRGDAPVAAFAFLKARHERNYLQIAVGGASGDDLGFELENATITGLLSLTSNRAARQTKPSVAARFGLRAGDQIVMAGDVLRENDPAEIDRRLRMGAAPLHILVKRRDGGEFPPEVLAKQVDVTRPLPPSWGILTERPAEFLVAGEATNGDAATAQRTASTLPAPAPPRAPYLHQHLIAVNDIQSAGLCGWAQAHIDDTVLKAQQSAANTAENKMMHLFGFQLDWAHYPIVRVAKLSPDPKSRARLNGVSVGDILLNSGGGMGERLTALVSAAGATAPSQTLTPNDAILDKILRRFARKESPVAAFLFLQKKFEKNYLQVELKELREGIEVSRASGEVTATSQRLTVASEGDRVVMAQEVLFEKDAEAVVQRVGVNGPRPLHVLLSRGGAGFPDAVRSEAGVNVFRNFSTLGRAGAASGLQKWQQFLERARGSNPLPQPVVPGSQAREGRVTANNVQSDAGVEVGIGSASRKDASLAERMKKQPPFLAPLLVSCPRLAEVGLVGYEHTIDHHDHEAGGEDAPPASAEDRFFRAFGFSLEYELSFPIVRVKKICEDLQKSKPLKYGVKVGDWLVVVNTQRITMLSQWPGSDLHDAILGSVEKSKSKSTASFVFLTKPDEYLQSRIAAGGETGILDLDRKNAIVKISKAGLPNWASEIGLQVGDEIVIVNDKFVRKEKYASFGRQAVLAAGDGSTKEHLDVMIRRRGGFPKRIVEKGVDVQRPLPVAWQKMTGNAQQSSISAPHFAHKIQVALDHIAPEQNADETGGAGGNQPTMKKRVGLFGFGPQLQSRIRSELAGGSRDSKGAIRNRPKADAVPTTPRTRQRDAFLHYFSVYNSHFEEHVETTKPSLAHLSQLEQDQLDDLLHTQTLLIRELDKKADVSLYALAELNLPIAGLFFLWERTATWESFYVDEMIRGLVLLFLAGLDTVGVRGFDEILNASEERKRVAFFFVGKFQRRHEHDDTADAGVGEPNSREGEDSGRAAAAGEKNGGVKRHALFAGNELGRRTSQQNLQNDSTQISEFSSSRRENLLLARDAIEHRNKDRAAKKMPKTAGRPGPSRLLPPHLFPKHLEPLLRDAQRFAESGKIGVGTNNSAREISYGDGGPHPDPGPLPDPYVPVYHHEPLDEVSTLRVAAGDNKTVAGATISDTELDAILPPALHSELREQEGRARSGSSLFFGRGVTSGTAILDQLRNLERNWSRNEHSSPELRRGRGRGGDVVFPPQASPGEDELAEAENAGTGTKERHGPLDPWVADLRSRPSPFAEAAKDLLAVALGRGRSSSSPSSQNKPGFSSTSANSARRQIAALFLEKKDISLRAILSSYWRRLEAEKRRHEILLKNPSLFFRTVGEQGAGGRGRSLSSVEIVTAPRRHVPVPHLKKLDDVGKEGDEADIDAGDTTRSVAAQVGNARSELLQKNTVLVEELILEKAKEGGSAALLGGNTASTTAGVDARRRGGRDGGEAVFVPGMKREGVEEPVPHGKEVESDSEDFRTHGLHRKYCEAMARGNARLAAAYAKKIRRDVVSEKTADENFPEVVGL